MTFADIIPDLLAGRIANIPYRENMPEVETFVFMTKDGSLKIGTRWRLENAGFGPAKILGTYSVDRNDLVSTEWATYDRPLELLW